MAPYQRWWLDRMSATRFPLEEKLTLYWHDHFATGFSKVRRPKSMVAQNRLLRDYAGGNFRALCNAITGDGAMLIWLDGNTNQKIQPNENYGREFMELFTTRPGPLHPGGRQPGRPGLHRLHHRRPGQSLVPPGASRRRGEDDPRPDRQVGAGRRHRYRPRPSPRRAGGGPLRVGPAGVVPLQARPRAEVVDAMASAFVDLQLRHQGDGRALLLRPEFSDGPGLTIKSPAEYIAGTMRLLRLTAAPRLRQPAPPQEPRRDRRRLVRHGPGAVRATRRVGLEGRGGVGQHRRHPGPLQLRGPHREDGDRQRRAHRPRHRPAGSPATPPRCGCTGSGCSRCSRPPRRRSTGTSKPRRRPRPTPVSAPGGSSRSCWPLPTST